MAHTFQENIYLPGDFILSRGELEDHVIYVVSGQAVVVGTFGGKKWRRTVGKDQVTG